MKRHFAYTAGLIGSTLLALNLYGLTTSLRPAHYDELSTHLGGENPISLAEFQAILDTPQDSTEDYVRMVNAAVHDNTRHYWLDPWEEGNGVETRYNMHIPIYENYLLYVVGFFRDNYKRLELTNYKRAYERGFGFCGQRAMILANALQSKDIPVEIVALDGHVITTVEINPGEWWLVDPDYGVMIPHTVETIQPEDVRTYYADQSETVIDLLVEIYSRPIFAVKPLEAYSTSWIFEVISYWLIWLIPIPFVLFGVVGVLRPHWL